MIPTAVEIRLGKKIEIRLLIISMAYSKHTVMSILLSPEENRWNIFPIAHPRIWQFYEKAMASLWLPHDVDLSKDTADWDNKLNDDERFFLSRVLAFFAAADGIVNDNLSERFGREVCIREAKFFYGLQMFMENIHSQMYSLLIDTYIKDAGEKALLFNGAESIPCVKKKAEWAARWTSSETASFAERLVAFAVVEGVFFSGSFCAIFWMKKRGLMPGLCQSNSYIARDEGMHQDFATFLYREYIVDKPEEETVHTIVRDAVEHEITFCTEAIPVQLLGMNSNDMAQYIQYVADRLLIDLQVSKLFHVKNPFEWMELICMENKTNFFESRVTEYKKTGAAAACRDAFSTDAEF